MKRETSKPTCIDLCCGCGGFSLGMQCAGISIPVIRTQQFRLIGNAGPPLMLEAVGIPALNRGDAMWTITEDLIDDGEKAGTSSCNYDETKAVLLKHRFRLLDDDGVIYYEGLSDNCDSQRAFGPLDDLGKGYAGCTEIHYFADGVWRQL